MLGLGPGIGKSLLTGLPLVRGGVFHSEANPVDSGEVASRFGHGIDDQADFVQFPDRGAYHVAHPIAGHFRFVRHPIPFPHLRDAEVIGLDVLLCHTVVLQHGYNRLHGLSRLQARL